MPWPCEESNGTPVALFTLHPSTTCSAARAIQFCFLAMEILSATTVQQRDRSELKISRAHASAPIADVGFGARMDWPSTDVALTLIAIICSENQQLPRRLTASERAQVGLVCGRDQWFRRQQDLSRHCPFSKSPSAAQ